MGRNLTIVSGLAGLVLLLAPPSAAQLMPPPVVNPVRYESRSSEYVLDVDPSEMYGQGSASYRLTRQGQDVWSGDRPFTLLGVGVSDDGVVAGFAYSGGLEGFAKDDRLHLVILDPSGAVRLDDTTPRQMSRVIDGGPEPNVHGLVFDPDNDRVVFRVSNVADPEVWKPYQLSTGKPARQYQPISLMAAGQLSLSIIDAQPVRGTPLTLVHWSRNNWDKDEHGTRFTLLDPTGKPAWTLDLPKDYQAPAGDRKAQERVWSLTSKTAILDVSRPKEFEIRIAATAERIRHAIEKDPKGVWRVRETERQRFGDEPPKAEAVPDAGPERPLKYLGAIKLGGSDAKAGAIRDVHKFDLDDRGRFGMARTDAQCEVTFVIGGDDETPREVKLGRLSHDQCRWPLVAWAGAKTWLVTVEYAKAEDGNAGWWVESESGATRPFILPRGVSVRAVAGRPSGGIVLLGERETPKSWGSELATVLLWIDNQGREEHGFSEAAHNSGSQLLSPDDVAVTTLGEVMVVDVIQHKVAVFDSRGSLRRTIDLEKAWGREPNYPSGIAKDIDGGFIVEDFDAATPFVRMRPDGTVLGQLQPRYEDGRPTGRLFRVQAGPDGTLWGSDGEALLRLTEEGIVEGAVGAPASVGDLGEVAALTLDAQDWIYAADRRTGAVHVFSPDGKLEHVCRPDPGDVKDSLDSPSLTVTRDGRIYLRPDSGLADDGGFIEFSASGQRVALHRWPDRSRLWNAATGGFWAIGWHDFALLDEGGQVVRRVARRSDRKWLDFVSDAAVAQDGSIAVAASSNLLRADSKESTLNLYAPDGAPVKTIRLAPEASSQNFAYDGRSIAHWQSGELRVLEASGKPISRFKPSPAGKPATQWPLVIAAQGHELWLFDGTTKAIQRYAMP